MISTHQGSTPYLQQVKSLKNHRFINRPIKVSSANTSSELHMCVLRTCTESGLRPHVHGSTVPKGWLHLASVIMCAGFDSLGEWGDIDKVSFHYNETCVCVPMCSNICVCMCVCINAIVFQDGTCVGNFAWIFEDVCFPKLVGDKKETIANETTIPKILNIFYYLY